MKVAPGLDHALIPAGAEAEWVSVDGDLVEAALWCGALAEVPRRATVLRPDAGATRSRTPPAPDGPGARQLTGSGTGDEAPVGPVRRYLYDPDPAVVRAHLVAELADTLDATLADPSIAYLYADTPQPTPFAPLPGDHRRAAVLAEAAARRCCGSAGGPGGDPQAGLGAGARAAAPGPAAGRAAPAASLVLTRVAGRADGADRSAGRGSGTPG